MKAESDKIKAMTARHPGIVVPIDVEALCVGKDPGNIFEQPAFNFEDLRKAPYLSGTASLDGTTNLTPGVHLHWALPDAITKGRQTADQLNFPAVPDRWLITRIFCDTDKKVTPRFDRWIVESNHFSTSDPDPARKSVAVPFQGSEWEKQPWRMLGKVSRFDDWMKSNAKLAAGSPDSYISGLTAVGYGTPDFAAAYNNAKNVLGFQDLGADLEKLGESPAGNKYVSYHIIGWYSNPAEDPIRQIPGAIPAKSFDELLSKIANDDDKRFVKASFRISAYLLDESIGMEAGDDIWDILRNAGYPLEIDIPTEISPEDFNSVLKNTPNPSEQAILKKWYLAVWGPMNDLDDESKIRLWDIMASNGFDFVHALLQRAKWALPSGTALPAVSPAFTVYSGMVNNVRWNKDEDYFTDKPGDNFNIAIGNTAGQALSALVANTSGFEPQNIPLVEEILDALQSGLLEQVKDESIFADWEELKATLHQSAFSSFQGGSLFEVHLTKETPESAAEVTLDEKHAQQLNALNTEQQKLNEYNDRIHSVRSQIFSDWYRFMLVYHKSPKIEVPPIPPGDFAEYITARVDSLTDLIEEANAVAEKTRTLEAELRNDLGSKLFLTKVSAPRFWQPNEPVLLFQGDGINPSDRYGNDGRYMYDETLVCRVSDQLIGSLNIPANAFGNSTDVSIDTSIFPVIPNPHQLAVLDCVNAVTIDAGMINEDIIADTLRNAGVTTPFAELVKTIEPPLMGFINPELPDVMSETTFNEISDRIAKEDADFLHKWYTLKDGQYVLNTKDLKDNDRLRLVYILVSASVSSSAGKLNYSGIAFSEVGLQSWNKNPWLPFSLKWRVYFYPLERIVAGGQPYPEDFITSQFKIGDTDLVYTGPSVTPDEQGITVYDNQIFLTPHANINLRKQLRQFIDRYPYDNQLKKDLEGIYDKLKDKPVLSQALSGINSAFLMLQKILQLPIADPAATPPYISFTNTIKDAVGANNLAKPATDNTYSPIRSGLMKIQEVTLVDVFGRNVSVLQPAQIFRAQDMKQTVMKPAISIYLAPRLVEPSRLQFRWLAANDDQVEMNTHPATTPICGWVLTNHLDSSLWIYDSNGNPYGSLILNYNNSAIVWQCAPGGPYFGLSLNDFFEELGTANKHLEKFVHTLYGDGGKANATYLRDFMKGLDDAAITIEPGNYTQYQSTAVLMGKPYALVRASLDLELMGDPTYSSSWPDTVEVVDEYASGKFVPGNDYGFTKVKFPVKIGNIPQTEDGLVGYFTHDDYSTFYCPSVINPTKKVLPPADDNLVVTAARGSETVIISMLIEPRGKIHASTGILPVKAIDIPPDQYLDALQKLQLSFLTSPLLTPKGGITMPLPSVTGGTWAWIENDGERWLAERKIQPVAVDAVMNFESQNILEGWLNLSSRLLTASNFSLQNQQTQTPVLFITNDPSKNVLTLSFINTTGLPFKLTGGEPVYGGLQHGGSSFAFNFGEMLSDTILSAIEVTIAGWNTRYFSSAPNAPAAWSIAPKQDLVLQPNDKVTVELKRIICPEGTPSGNFMIGYYNFPEIPDSISPVLLPLTVQSLPQTISKNSRK